MGSHELCLALMHADTDAEVVAILADAGYWDDAKNWRYLGDMENNFATVGNQQADAVAAIVEKLVNGVDARLIAASLLAGIDPKADAAPADMRRAVARFFEDRADLDSERAGRIAFWPAERTLLEGRLLTLAASGNTPPRQPSLSIADAGEGQTPGSFPSTFMSLAKSNKFRIPFVQGKFNMGGTGALQFCSEPNRLQLIVSRRDPRLLGTSSSERDREWGFTVVRREPPTGNQRSSVFTYLAPVGAEARDGDVLSFPAPELPIFPEDDRNGRGAYFRTSPHGSLIKLYEYRWQGTTTNIIQARDGLLRRLDQALPEVALPVRLYESRPSYRGHPGSFSTNLTGLSARLEKDRAEKLEEGFPTGSIIDIDGHQVKIRVFAFKKKEAAAYRTSRNGVIFTINGQTHATLPTDFFTRKSVGMGYLASDLLVVLDCSEIAGLLREDLFMNSRDRLRETKLSERIIGELESILHDDPTLRELRNRRRKEDIDEKLAEDKPLAEALEAILKSNPTLEKLFLRGTSISAPFAREGAGEGEGGDFHGKPWPTYFRLKGKAQDEELIRDARLASRPRVSLVTDAEDAYFVREMDPGEWAVYRTDREPAERLANCRMDGPHSGVALLHVALPDDAATGAELPLEIEVSDPSRVDPFVNRLVLRLKPAEEGGGGGGATGARRRRSGNRGSGRQGDRSGLALPEVTRVREDTWNDYSFHTFTENDALVVVLADGDGDHQLWDFYVNVDNKFLRTVQKESPKEDPRLIETKFVYANVLIGLALLTESAAASSGDGEAHEEVSMERYVGRTTSQLAPIMLPMIDAIGGLSVDDVLGE
ncbi:MAG: hypothetical protein ACT4OS_11450 [Acidimicrobiales bacterium]